jgi:hypothetical protein
MAMATEDFNKLFHEGVLKEIFPDQKADQFFEALYGGTEDGAFSINLTFVDYDQATNALRFQLQLRERPGKCLACNLTYGLPRVFSRHPVINLQGVVREIEKLLNGKGRCLDWSLGNTNPVSNKLHIIPLTVRLG